MNFKKTFLALSLTGFIIDSIAQQLPLFNGKFINEYSNNPAAAGEKNIARASASFRTQYDNMPNSPIGFGVMADGKFKNQKHGFGVQLIGQRTNFNTLYNGMLTYSYEIIPDKEAKQKLTFGLSVGAYMQSTDFSKIKVNQVADPRLLDGQISNTAMEMNVGVLYRIGRLRVGASVHNLLGNGTYLRNEFTDTFSIYQSHQHYFGSASYAIRLKKDNPDYILEPYLAVNAVSGLAAKTDLLVSFKYLQKYHIGFGYRAVGSLDAQETPSSSYVMCTGIKLYDKLDLGYFFEMLSGTENRSALGNSHELHLTYYLPYRR